MAKTKEKSLIDEQREKIMEVIRQKQAPDDRDPQVVIETEFKGDEDAYLRVMARWHNVQLDTN